MGYFYRSDGTSEAGTRRGNGCTSLSSLFGYRSADDSIFQPPMDTRETGGSACRYGGPNYFGASRMCPCLSPWVIAAEARSNFVARHLVERPWHMREAFALRERLPLIQCGRPRFLGLSRPANTWVNTDSLAITHEEPVRGAAGRPRGRNCSLSIPGVHGAVAAIPFPIETEMLCHLRLPRRRVFRSTLRPTTMSEMVAGSGTTLAPKLYCKSGNLESPPMPLAPGVQIVPLADSVKVTVAPSGTLRTATSASSKNPSIMVAPKACACVSGMVSVSPVPAAPAVPTVSIVCVSAFAPLSSWICSPEKRPVTLATLMFVEPAAAAATRLVGCGCSERNSMVPLPGKR